MSWEIETFIILFGGGTGIVSALGQFMVKEKREANYNMAALWLTLGLLMFQCASLISGYSRLHSWILCYHLTLIWLQAPLLYIAYYFLVNTGGRYPDRIVTLFIPSIVAFIADTVFITASVTNLIPDILWIFTDRTSIWITIKNYMLIAGTIQIIIFLVVFILRMAPEWRLSRMNGILSITILYALSSIIATLFLLGGYISKDIFYLKTASLLASAGMILIAPVRQRFPKYLQLLESEVKKERYKKSLLAGRNVAPILELMTSLMEKDMLYRDENLTLKTLSDHLSINPHQLSQLLNDNLNTNFSNYINRYRITEAEKLLIEKPERPVLAIAFDVGFNNKTSFYDAFSRFNGISPHKYRKNKSHS